MLLLFEILQLEGIVYSPVHSTACKGLPLVGFLVTRLLPLLWSVTDLKNAGAAQWAVRRQLQHNEYSCSIVIIL